MLFIIIFEASVILRHLISILTKFELGTFFYKIHTRKWNSCVKKNGKCNKWNPVIIFSAQNGLIMKNLAGVFYHSFVRKIKFKYVF